MNQEHTMYRYVLYPAIIFPLKILWKIIWRLIKVDKLSICLAAIYFLFIRVFFTSLYFIPSPSMIPTLLKNDYIVSSKMSYGYNKYSFPLGCYYPKYITNLFSSMFGSLSLTRPVKRGDVVIFWPPNKADGPDFYVKRVIGLPGDKIKMDNGVLSINGQIVEQNLVKAGVEFFPRDTGCEKIKGNVMRETLPNGVTHLMLKSYKPQGNPPDFPESPLIVKVPSNHYFMMGDNRDFSSDSRSGYITADSDSEHAQYRFKTVPQDNIIAQVKSVIFSTSAHWYNPLEYISGLRQERLGWVK